MIRNNPHASNLRGILWNAIPRGLALFLGGFSLLNIVGSAQSAGFDANLWWIDLRSIPQSLANIFILVCALCLIGFAIRPPQSNWRRGLTVGCVAIMGITAAVNSVSFYLLLRHQSFSASIPFPLSVFITIALGLILVAKFQPTAAASPSWTLAQVFGVLLACLVTFPLGQMFCFGKTDYRRSADVAVVLGARVYADGRPSDALADRVRTACQLYRQGLAKKLLFSGGPGDGSVHETDSMRNMAVRLGVKPEDIFVDREGVNTQATVINSLPIFSNLHASRILVVSHFYHLPRIKLAYQRQGLNVYTVPARETYLLRQMPFNMAREVAALWVYYLRPLNGNSAVRV